MNAGSPPLLVGKHHTLFKTIRGVASRARHVAPELVLAEGLKTVEEAARSGHAVEAVLISDAFGATARQSKLVSEFLSRRVKIWRTTDALFRAAASTVTPQGILALVRVPLADIPDRTLPEHPLILCAAGIQDPGNLGTLVRTAAAAGSALVLTTPGTVSPRNPKAIRASAGAFFHVLIVEHVPPAEIRRYCRQHGILIYRTAAGGELDYSTCDLRGGVALVFGNEARGVEDSAWAEIPAITIPLANGVESLSVAAAGAILLFEAARQRKENLAANSTKV